MNDNDTNDGTMNDNETTNGREVEGTAKVAVMVEELADGYPMVMPVDVDWNDYGDYVSDRIEGQSAVAMPPSEWNPAPGEEKLLGTVTWDDRGMPITLKHESGKVIHFDANGVISDYSGGGDE